MRLRNLATAAAIGACGSALASTIIPAAALAAAPDGPSGVSPGLRANGSDCSAIAYAPSLSSTGGVEFNAGLACYNSHATRVVTYQLEQKTSTGSWNRVGAEVKATLTAGPSDVGLSSKSMACSGVHTYRTRATVYYYGANETAWSPGSTINCTTLLARRIG